MVRLCSYHCILFIGMIVCGYQQVGVIMSPQTPIYCTEILYANMTNLLCYFYINLYVIMTAIIYYVI